MTPAQDIPAKKASVALALILLGRLILGVAYSALNPLGEAPDEADHYAYVSYVGRERRLPEGNRVTQGKHPPLYYVTAAAVSSWTGLDFTFLRSNPDVALTPGAAAPNFFVHTSLEDWPWRDGALAMHLARLVSVLAGVVLTAATYALGRAVWREGRAGPLAAAAFVAFLPESLFIGGSVSNDIPAAMFATLALWAALRGNRLRGAVAAGVFIGLATLTKVSASSLAPAIGAAMLLQRGWNPDGLRRGLMRLAAAGGVALAIVSPWLWRNWRLYGDLLGWPVVLATVDQRQGPLVWSDYAWLARGWFLGFWGKFGGAGHMALPDLLYAVWGAWVLLGIGGWLLWLTFRRRERRLGQTSLANGSALLLAPVLVILTMLSYSRVALGTDQGRLLFPILAPVALILVAGLAAWIPAERPAWLVGGVSGIMAVVAVAALLVGIVRPFAPPPPPAPQELAQASPIGQTFGVGLELTSLRWGIESDGDSSSLTLYWRAQQPMRDDLRIALRLVDGGGNLIWEWKRSPGAGRFSTDRWPEGRMVADAYRIPGEALSRAARVDVGVFDFLGGSWLPLQGQIDAVFVTLPRATG